MKSIFVSSLLCLALHLSGQAQSFVGLDNSPLDIAYYPDNFAHDRKEGEKALVKVIYSRPHKNGRDLFGSLIPYGKVWRTGANEATEIIFYQDATIAGKKIKKGTYALFTIPDKETWTVILNKDLDYWGAYKYNPENDLLRATVQSERLKNEIENFTIQFSGKEKNKAIMMMAWGDTLVEVPIQF